MGLDVELFQDGVDPEFICGLCHKVLLNPVTAGCNHIFCQSCVHRIIKSRVTRSICPSCSAKLKQDYTDTSIDFKLKLLNLSMRCTHQCGEEFLLGELPDHMEVCPLSPVPCGFKDKGCKKTVKRCDLRKHLDECDFRTVECEACGFQTIYCELFTHQSKVRCLEKKLKQQIIRERKAASQEINRHREKMFRDTIRLEQQQRQRILTHSKSLNLIKAPSRMRTKSRRDSDSEFDYADGVFMTERPVIHQEEKNHVTNNHNVNEYLRESAKTPHSSRSGFVLQICSQCDKRFRADTNHQQSCRWHVGVSILKEWSQLSYDLKFVRLLRMFVVDEHRRRRRGERRGR